MATGNYEHMVPDWLRARNLSGLGAPPYAAAQQFWIRVNTVPGVPSAKWRGVKGALRESGGIDLLQWPTSTEMSSTIKISLRESLNAAQIQQRIKNAVVDEARVEVTSVGPPRPIVYGGGGGSTAPTPPSSPPRTPAPPPRETAPARASSDGGGGGSPPLPFVNPPDASITTPSGTGPDWGKIILYGGGVLLAGAVLFFVLRKVKAKRAARALQAAGAATPHRVANRRRNRRRNSHRRNGGYQIPRLTKTEYATLQWLADRGYDAGILEAAGVEEEYDDGSVLLGLIPEHKAWGITEEYEADPRAFLASSGSRSLNEKLYRFLDSIV